MVLYKMIVRFVWVGICTLIFGMAYGNARTLEVGPGKEFLFPSVAAKFAKDGDVIEIDASGEYLNEHAIWLQNNITIKGVNGRPHMRSFGLIPNGKAIWVIRATVFMLIILSFPGLR